MDIDPPEPSSPVFNNPPTTTTETTLTYSQAPSRASLATDVALARNLQDLKNHALSHARILYGSEARKFFDILDAPISPGKYIAALVCSLDGETKTLRMCYADDPVEAANELVQGLKRDTGALYCKIKTGDQITGQQGYTDLSGIFRIDETKHPRRPLGAVDSTESLKKFMNAPTRPRADSWYPVAKRSRLHSNCNVGGERDLDREAEGKAEPAKEESRGEGLDYGGDAMGGKVDEAP